MNEEQKKNIKSTILECREILEKDIEQVLINLGIYVDKDWINVRDLVNLSEEEEKNRVNIEKAIEKLQKGGFAKENAISEYIKEVSYTYLNRLSALRVMEVRGLIDEILISKDEYGNKSFIGSRFYEVAREYCRYEVDEGLSFLLNIMFEEINEEINILFNNDNEYSFITPSNMGLIKTIDLLCENIDEDSWKQDEIIGWIYQYFNSKEKDNVYDKLYNEKQKIKVEDIPAATQLFTPEWIVDWIVESSLGKLWSELKKGKRDKKKVEEIKLLDPCCGSGHFLVKAYDLFFQMYLEEGIYSKEEIPYKILEKNIHGIDIDLRAIQLSALILFIKTKTYLKENNYSVNTKGKISVNLVCADTILLNGNKLIQLKQKHKDNDTILRMIDIIYEEFEDIRLKGSLIQPEKKIFPLFEEFKSRVAKKELNKVKRRKKKQIEGQERLIDDEIKSLSYYKSNRDFTKEEKDLIISLDSIYNEAVKANNMSNQLFANEAKKSIKLIDVFMKEYDVVVTNPPYMGSSSMDDTLRSFISKNYASGKEDLYATFILRCLEMLKNNGLLGMITQHGFMFTSRYSKLREEIIRGNHIKEVIHLGTGVFEELSGEKVESAMFVLEKNLIETKSKFYDVRNEVDRELFYTNKDKIKKYEVDQNIFNNIKGSPFLYKLSEELFTKFKMSNFEDYAHIQRGISTSNDRKYMRFFWEIKDTERWKMNNRVSSEAKYLTEDNIVIDWSKEAIDFYESKNGLTGENYYFKEGLFFSKAPYKANFSVRYLNNKSIINDSKPSIFLKDNNDLFLFLGILNSNLFIFFMNIINPTNAFQVGDVRKLPILKFNDKDSEKIKKLSKENLKLTRKLLSYSVVSRYYLKEKYSSYISKGIKSDILRNLITRDNLILQRIKNESEIDSIVYKTYELTSEEVAYIEEENNISNENIKDKDKMKIESLKDMNGFHYEKLSSDLNVNMIDLIKYRIKNECYGKRVIKQELISFLDLYLGKIFGRFEYDEVKVNKDEIIPLDSSIYLEEDIIEIIYNFILKKYGINKADKIFEEIEDILGQHMEDYFIKSFFKDHIRLYKKRPIYWHISSPKKTFNCFIYYHKINNDTLYKVKSIYLGQMINRYSEDLKYYTDQLIKARTDGDKIKEKDLGNRCAELEEKLEDLNILDNNIMELLPYNPDIDEGVLKNIIPIESILSSTISTPAERRRYQEEVEKQ